MSDMEDVEFLNHIQVMEFLTKHGRLYSVQIERMTQNDFRCEMTAKNYGGNEEYLPLGNADSANAAFQLVLLSLTGVLAGIDGSDKIAEINNLADTPVINVAAQKLLVDESVIVKEAGQGDSLLM